MELTMNFIPDESPHIYKKAMLDMLRQDFTIINCDRNELVFQIPLIYPYFLDTVQDIMK